MTKGINPARMTLRLEFGSMKPVGKVNPNTGEAEDEFVPAFSLWAGQWSLSMLQQMTLAGNGMKDNVVFFTRFNNFVKEGMHLRKDKQDVYFIDNVNVDDGLPPDGFNLITCHRVVSGHD